MAIAVGALNQPLTQMRTFDHVAYLGAEPVARATRKRGDAGKSRVLGHTTLVRQ
jgi:hypothetical protein